MQRDSIFRKSKFWIIIILIGLVIYIWQSMEFTFFGHIKGLYPHIHLGTQHENLIEHMGEPDKVEIVVRDGGDNRYVIHYDGVIFTVFNNRVVTIEITGGQFSLGGQR